MIRHRQGASAPAHHKGLLAIGLFKLLKAALLIIAGIAARGLLHHDVYKVAMHVVNLLQGDPHNRIIHAILTKLLAVNDHDLQIVSIVTFAYAALFVVEGTGLVLERRWAEYLTILTTAGLLPLEVYELFHHARPMKVLVLIVNLLILIYLLLMARGKPGRTATS